MAARRAGAVIAGVVVSALAYTVACPPYEWWPAAWIVSPYGEAYALVPPDTAGSAVARVEARSERTAYVRWGESWVAVAGGLIGLAAVFGRRREGATTGIPMPARQEAR